MLLNVVQRELRTLLSKANYYRKISRGTPIIVYQMGKVGSRSVCDSLESCRIGPVFHVHRLNPNTLLPWHSERLYMDIIKKQQKAKFITLVREPIARNISHLFRVLSVDTITGTEIRNTDFNMEELYNAFIEKVTYHWTPLEWFDEEVKRVIGIDVYEHPFPKETGYLSIRKGPFELLILKLEIDDAVKEKAISEFLGKESFKLKRSNLAETKDYAELYQYFVQNVILPQSYVEIMCNSDYVRHFYTDAEIESIYRRWRSDNNINLAPTLYKKLFMRATRTAVDQAP